MVLKLIKNEFKQSSHKFLPVLIMILTVTILIVTPIVKFDSNPGFFELTLSFIIFAFSIAVIVMSFVAVIDLLYTSLYDKNGYKLFTTPVALWEILVAKVCVFYLWTMLIALTTFLAISLILVILLDGQLFALINSFITYFLGEVGLLNIGLFLLSGFASSLMAISIFLFVGSFTNSSLVRKGRNILTFIIYMILNVAISQLLYQFSINTDALIDVKLKDGFLAMSSNFNPIVDGWGPIISVTNNLAGAKSLIMAVIIYLAVALIMFILTIELWDNKLEIIE